MEEEWKYIKEAPDYMISNYGRIMSLKPNYYKRICSPKTSKRTGYVQIVLKVNKNISKTFLVHRLVLSNFNPIDNMEDYKVNHKDENKENNRLDNLEWVTVKYNCNYGTRNERISKSKEVKVECIETGIIYDSFHKAAEATGADVGSINMCCTGYRNRKSAGGLHWRYANE